mmetsp:Transcript_116576/g.310131  ORF Transcript_116576/g.310131 Transcript_116576/m.310131 type:complete len:231 (-) Transcript_116576:689-1381(-)
MVPLRQASRRMSWMVKGRRVRPRAPSSSKRPPRSLLRVATSMAISEVSASSCSRRTSASRSSSLCAAARASMARRSSSASCTANLVSAQSWRRNDSFSRIAFACAATSASAALQTSSRCTTREEPFSKRSRSRASSCRRLRVFRPSGPSPQRPTDWSYMTMEAAASLTSLARALSISSRPSICALEDSITSFSATSRFRSSCSACSSCCSRMRLLRKVAIWESSWPSCSR